MAGCGCGEELVPAPRVAYEWAADDGRTQKFDTGDPIADLDAARAMQKSERTGIIRSQRIRGEAQAPATTTPGMNPRTLAEHGGPPVREKPPKPLQPNWKKNRAPL